MNKKRIDKIDYFCPAWATDTNRLLAGFSCRHGGVSRAPFNSLNFGFNTEDLPAHIEGNRASFCRSFGYQPHQLLTVRQVHGNNLLLIDDENLDVCHFQTVEADAMITNQSGFVLAILVADCFPLLLHDPVQGVIAAVHLGWRGTASGLIGQTVCAMEQSFSCRPADLHVALGPGIAAHQYEVDRPVREAFRTGSNHWDLVSRETRVGHWQLDLGLSCTLQLEQAGVLPQQIERVEECTCCHPELFFSHRRDQGKTGRQIGFIALA